MIYGPPSKVLLYPTGTGQTKILTTGLTVEYVTWLTDEKPDCLALICLGAAFLTVGAAALLVARGRHLLVDAPQVVVRELGRRGRASAS